MSDFNFCGPSYVAKSIYQDDQESINWYCQFDPNKAKASPEGAFGRGYNTLYATPGLSTRIGPTVNPTNGLPVASILGNLGVRGMHVIPGGAMMLVVAGATLYAVTTAYTVTAVGVLLTNAGLVSISDNGVAAIIGDGPNRYFYNWNTNTFTISMDGAFTAAGKTEIADNFLLYTNPGTNQWGATSALSITSPALSFTSGLASPWLIQGLKVVNRDVYAIFEKYTEVWLDAGLFPFPFQIIGGTALQHGTGAPNSIERLGEGFAMLAQDTRGDSTVITVNAYKPSRISTFAVEDAINGYAVTSDAIGMTHQWGGHEFYMLTFPTADVTWVYDLATQLWHKRAYRDANGVLHRHRANCMALFNGEVVVGDYQTGNLYAFSDSTYTDAMGATMPCIRRCPHLTSDLNRQFFHDLQIQFQPGVGLQTGQGTDPQAMLTYSDDGGSTWSNQHWTSIGKVGKYKNRARWTRLGQARDRIFEVQVTDPVIRNVISANLNASAGAN